MPLRGMGQKLQEWQCGDCETKLFFVPGNTKAVAEHMMNHKKSPSGPASGESVVFLTNQKTLMDALEKQRLFCRFCRRSFPSANEFARHATECRGM